MRSKNERRPDPKPSAWANGACRATWLTVPRAATTRRSPLHPRHQRVADLEIRGHILHVVVVIERPDQPENLFAGLVVDENRVLRPPDDRRLARFAELRLQRLLRVLERLDRGHDLVFLRARLYVVGARLDRRIDHRFVAGDLLFVNDEADV